MKVERMCDEDVEGEGISDVRLPPQVLEDSDEFTDLEINGGIEDEDYYASLFSKCDYLDLGIAKVSNILYTLRDLQALAIDMRSQELDNSCTAELEELKKILDPNNQDPDITLGTFKMGLSTYLKKRDWSSLSPIRKVVRMSGESDSVGPLSSSPNRGRKVFDLNISNISLRADENDFSLEGLAGTTNSTSFDARDWQAELSDLHLQLQKAHKDNDNLRKSVREAQDENFNLLRAQRDEMNQQDMYVKVNSVRVQRLEAEINEKKATIASLEDKVTVLGQCNSRLENQSAIYQRERKELVNENEELKAELKKTLGYLTARDDTINKIKTAHACAIKEREDKVKWLNERNEALTFSIQQLEGKLLKLEEERSDQETKISLLQKAETQMNSSCHATYAHADSFEMDVSLDDIQTELLAAEVDPNRRLSFSILHAASPMPSLSLMERFDVAVQCEEVEKVNAVVQCVLENFEPELQKQLFLLISEIQECLKAVHPPHHHNHGSNGVTGNEPVGDANVPQGDQTRVVGSNGTHRHNSSNNDQQATNVVREIHDELVEFRDQLKKSHELLNFLRYQSTQSISLTKSCPGLAMDPSNGSINLSTGEGNRQNKAVSVAIQTDSPEVETPLLAQKLYLISTNGKLPDHHLTGGLADSENHNSFDKLSDDGSVRVRDDLSMVLEVSEQETEVNPGEAFDSMSFERGASQGGNRPPLKRMAKAAEDEDFIHSSQHPTSSRDRSTPSRASTEKSHKDDDYETLTPLDGDRTPVNNGDQDEDQQFNSASENCSPRSAERGPPLDFHSPTESSGRIPESKMGTMMMLTHNPHIRASHSEAVCLKTKKEWQQLRYDKDQKDREIYKKAYAQEEGNEDGSGGPVGGGVEGGVAFPASQSAFALDEEAELYLEALPNLAEELFDALNVMREKNESPTEQDLQDLERKFNNMANVFQTEHTSLEPRMNSLSKDLKESQESLKCVSNSIKTCLNSLNQFSKSSGTGVPIEDLLEVVKSLSNISAEFDHYSTTACRNARRLGMMDVQNRLHKMMDVMILYVHIIRTKYDNLTSEYSTLSTDMTRVRELLKENNIPFVSAHAASGGSYQLNNNDDKCLWDEEEMENSSGDRGYEDESEEPEKFYQLQHLLGPKKSSAGLGRNKERLNPKEKKSSENLVIRYLTDMSEVIRRELFWPWNTEQTMKGLKQGFAVVLMVLGIFVFSRGFVPSVSAINNSGCSRPTDFKSAESYFSTCGHLHHQEPPVI